MQIRRPKQEEIQQIHDLFSLTIKDTFQKEGIQDILEKEINAEIQTMITGLANDFSSEGEREYFLIASEGPKVVGTIAYGNPNALIRKHLDLDLKDIPEIKCVYVLPDFQQKGVGGLLLLAMERILASNKISSFYLDCGYKQAQVFWRQKLGEPICFLENHWGKGNHHMIWYKELSSHPSVK